LTFISAILIPPPNHSLSSEEKMMQKYTVIWRDDGDDFMFTVVDTDKDSLNITNDEWVQWAAEIEYADWDQAEQIAARADLLENGYDLLAVVKGELEYVA
jgi:hypothetical protein